MRAAGFPASRDIRSAARDGEAGFTLIELLVVLAVVGLVIAMAPALLSGVHGATATKAAVQAIANDLRTARGQAIVSGDEVRLVLDVASRSYQIAPDGPVRILPAAVDLEFTGTRGQISGDHGMIRFFADGSSSGGVLRLRAGERVRQIAVHWLTGRISIDE